MDEKHRGWAGLTATEYADMITTIIEPLLTEAVLYGIGRGIERTEREFKSAGSASSFVGASRCVARKMEEPK